MFYPLEDGAALCFHGYASLLLHTIGGGHCVHFGIVYFLVQREGVKVMTHFAGQG